MMDADFKSFMEKEVCSRYFRRDGTPYNTLMEWAKDFEKQDRHVGKTNLWWGGFVSTVWLGLDHSFRGGPPLIFETMVFARTIRINRMRARITAFYRFRFEFVLPRISFSSNGRDLDMDRYSTEAEALAGHKAMVKKWSRPYSVAWTLIKKLFRRY